MKKQCTPEQYGISSRELLGLIETFDGYGMHTHSIIISRGDEILAESYYKPFNESFLHRMYSVSKTFVTVAVGMAYTEGLLKLEDKIIDYFPEFRNESTDEFTEECTILDMLKMKSNISAFAPWWGKYKSRVEAYYTLKSTKIPGTLFTYDSMGSFLLGCIVERLTKKTFLDYLKEKVLLDIGFSKESYTLAEEDGYTVGDSGVMCTARDLWLFSRFIMRGGEWGGRQYIDRTFMEDMVKCHSYNGFGASPDFTRVQGYGYLTWRAPGDCFSLNGLGGQFSICHPKSDVMLSITADNQDDGGFSKTIIMHEFTKRFLPLVSDVPLDEDKAGFGELTEYLSGRELVSLKGSKASIWTERVSGVKYKARKNELGIQGFTLDLCEDSGTLTLHFNEKDVIFDFGLCTNKLTEFSYGTRAKADMMGVDIEGKYSSAISASWVDTDTFAVMAQVIDTYFGSACVYICFKDSRATVKLTKSGQYVFDGMQGFLICDKY